MVIFFFRHLKKNNQDASSAHNLASIQLFVPYQVLITVIHGGFKVFPSVARCWKANYQVPWYITEKHYQLQYYLRKNHHYFLGKVGFRYISTSDATKGREYNNIVFTVSQYLKYLVPDTMVVVPGTTR